jgi:hypothetical protein
MATFYSRYKRYKLAAVATIGTIDFSGGKTPPAEGDGYYVTTDADIIDFLRAHAAYNIDFAETPFTNAPDAPYMPEIPGTYRKYNVYDYGAKGDGVTDDTPAIKTAFATATGPLVIEFPAGTFLLTETLHLPDNCILRGAGKHATVVKTVDDDILNMYGSGFRAIQDMTLEISEPSNAKHWINTSSAEEDGGGRLFIENVHISCPDGGGYNHTAIIVEPVMSIEIRNLSASGSGISAAGDSSLIAVEKYATDVRVYDTHIEKGDWTAPAINMFPGDYDRAANALVIAHNCTFLGGGVSVRNQGEGEVRLSNCKLNKIECSDGRVELDGCTYTGLKPTATGYIIDLSQTPGGMGHRRLTLQDVTLLTTRTAGSGTATDAGDGQIQLLVTDDGEEHDVAGIEQSSNADGSGVSANWHPERSPRFAVMAEFPSLDANTRWFAGLRETPSPALPLAAEQHTGFAWDGTALQLVSSGGEAVSAIDLTAYKPAGGAMALFEVWLIDGRVRYRVDGYPWQSLGEEIADNVPTTYLQWAVTLATTAAGGGAYRMTVRDLLVQENMKAISPT